MLTDGFGQRTTGVDSETGDQVELLEFGPAIVEHTGFVTALAERVARFASVRHASYVHLRRLDRPAADRLQLVSDLTPGWRLSELLEESTAADIPVDITVVIALLRQLLPAVALFGRHNRENAIGALSPHRLIVTPQARLVIAEHAFGPAIEKLNLGREKLWRDFRVSMPPSAGLPRANPRADANAIGVVALTLLLGRSLELDEFPAKLEGLVEGAQEHRDGQGSPLSASFKNWLKRALQFEVSSAFQSPSEAQLAFESVLASDRSYVTASSALANWVTEIGGTIDIKRKPAAPPPPPKSQPQAEPAPPKSQPKAESAPVIMSSSGVAMESDAIAEPKPAEEAQEIEISLDELEPAPQSPARVEPEPEPEPEPVEAAPEPEPEPEPEVFKPAPRPAFTREQLEEDPIARELLNYKPKYEAAAPPPPPPPPPPPSPPPPPPPPPPPVQEPEPVEEVVEEPEPVEEQPVEEPEPEPAPAPDRSWAPAPQYPEQPAPAAQEPPRTYQPPPLVYPPPQARPYEEPQPQAEAYEETAAAAPAAYEPPQERVAPVAAPPPSPPPSRVAIEDDDEETRGPLRNPIVLGLVGVVVLLLAVVGWVLTRGGTGDGGMREGEGELVVQSRPEGAQVKIDGEVKGNTPLTVRLDAGAHVLEVQSGKSEPRVIPLMITAGVQTSQYVELQGVAKTGGVEIRSEPAGARITIDGRPRGTTPTTVSDLAPGDHTVVLEAGGRKVSQTVRIQAGTTAKLSVPMRR